MRDLGDDRDVLFPGCAAAWLTSPLATIAANAKAATSHQRRFQGSHVARAVSSKNARHARESSPTVVCVTNLTTSDKSAPPNTVSP